MRYFRDHSWTNISSLSTSQDYYLVFTQGNPASWATSTIASAPIGGVYTRKVNVFDVYRSSSTDDIVSSGGVVDSNIRRIRVTISWQDQRGTRNFFVETYLANLF